MTATGWFRQKEAEEWASTSKCTSISTASTESLALSHACRPLCLLSACQKLYTLGVVRLALVAPLGICFMVTSSRFRLLTCSPELGTALTSPLKFYLPYHCAEHM